MRDSIRKLIEVGPDGFYDKRTLRWDSADVFGLAYLHRSRRIKLYSYDKTAYLYVRQDRTSWSRFILGRTKWTQVDLLPEEDSVLRVLMSELLTREQNREKQQIDSDLAAALKLQAEDFKLIEEKTK